MRYKFVKYRRVGENLVPVLRTEYACAEGKSAEENLAGLRKLDYSAIAVGYWWNMLPEDEADALTVVREPSLESPKEWSGKFMTGVEPEKVADAKVHWGTGGVDEETYIKRMAAAGIDRETALRVRSKARV